MEETAPNPIPANLENSNPPPNQDVDWSATIDKEIQAQLAGIESLAGNSSTAVPSPVQTVETNQPAVPTSIPPETKTGELKPEFLTTTTRPEVKPLAKTAPISEPVETTAEENLDPLSESVLKALNNLKEGDKVNEEWTLAKIAKMSFGSNASSFYELVNAAGANWTLNTEEMKHLLRKEITGKKEEVKAEKLSDISPTQEVKQESQIETKNPFTLPKEIETETVKVQAEENSHTTVGKFNLTTDQIALLKKIHDNNRDWNAFTSISASQWTEINQLYEDGKLSEIGIDATPLFDFLANPDLGSLIEVNKGDNLISILQKNGHKITWTSEDGPLLAIHALANRRLLEEMRKKAETLGLSIKTLPTDKDLVELAEKSKGGNSESYQELSEAVQVIPLHERLKILSPSDVEKLTSYLKN